MSEFNKKDYIDYRMGRAFETLNEVKDLLQLGYLHTSVNRLYYAAYYSLNALLVSLNISEPATHSGLRRIFGKEIIERGLMKKDFGKFYSRLYDERQHADYSGFSEYDKDVVIELYEKCNEFINEIKRLIYKN